MSLKQRLIDDMKTAMKAGDKHSLGVIRLVNAAIKQKEVDERASGQGGELDDAAVLAVLDKMVKQRRDSVSQYEAAGREDLARVERDEIEVIERYLPAKLGEAEIAAAIDAAIAQIGAATGKTSPADMGKLMGVLKPQLAGQADMGLVSKLVKQRLAG
ncbi:GatB/YqeY domain-containing protein [Marilutibacter chinensis]|uniref:GatB/YqeY domain-containing protein n=1 Tax=Marilutibacter chinensis TaxID=2912247 RepID=A0ABS9HUU2_9GAMM|nr:GatB/YqeY domain-containing protein [Lysobacter chinensis]MCF7222135.1 GatB/YqeY domain-containing protein [Lysobacter chinensis]